MVISGARFYRNWLVCRSLSINRHLLIMTSAKWLYSPHFSKQEVIFCVVKVIKMSLTAQVDLYWSEVLPESAVLFQFFTKSTSMIALWFVWQHDWQKKTQHHNIIIKTAAHPCEAQRTRPRNSRCNPRCVSSSLFDIFIQRDLVPGRDGLSLHEEGNSHLCRQLPERES